MENLKWFWVENKEYSIDIFFIYWAWMGFETKRKGSKLYETEKKFRAMFPGNIELIIK